MQSDWRTCQGPGVKAASPARACEDLFQHDRHIRQQLEPCSARPRGFHCVNQATAAAAHRGACVLGLQDDELTIWAGRLSVWFRRPSRRHFLPYFAPLLPRPALSLSPQSPLLALFFCSRALSLWFSCFLPIADRGVGLLSPWQHGPPLPQANFRLFQGDLTN